MTNNNSPENINCVPYDYKFNYNFEDTIQTLKFHPNPNSMILSAAGWDSKVHIWDVKYEVQQSLGYMGGYNSNNQQQINFNTNLIGGQSFPQPILSTAWKGNSTTLFVSDAAGAIYSYDVQGNQIQKLGEHKSGCKELAYYDESALGQSYGYNNSGLALLISAGWDGMLNFWDMRQSTPAYSINMNNKIFTMSLSKQLLILGMDNIKVAYFNLSKLRSNFQKEAEFDSHLKLQTKAVAAFPDATGYSIGSVEGRVAIKHIELNKTPIINNNIMTNTKDFAFRCHRSGKDNSEIYPVNCITFNQVHHTFATGGGDGRFFYGINYLKEN